MAIYDSHNLFVVSSYIIVTSRSCSRRRLRVLGRAKICTAGGRRSEQSASGSRTKSARVPERINAGCRPAATCIACCIGFAVAPLLRCVTQDRIERTTGTKNKEMKEFEFAGQSPSRKVLLCTFVDVERVCLHAQHLSKLSTSLLRKLPNSSPELR